MIRAWLSRALTRLAPAAITEDEFDALAASGEPVMVVGYAAPNGWTCDHVTTTAVGAARLVSAQAWCGCVMRPTYATR